MGLNVHTCRADTLATTLSILSHCFLVCLLGLDQSGLSASLRSCVKVEVATLGSPSLTVRVVSVAVKLKCCFTSKEIVGLLGTGAQDVHLDFHTAPEL